MKGISVSVIFIVCKVKMTAGMGSLDVLSYKKKVMMETSDKRLVQAILGTDYVKQGFPAVFLLSTILPLRFC